MKATISSLLLILLLISAGPAQKRINYGQSEWGPIDFVWTDLSSRQCKRLKPDSQFRACPPVAGYQLLFTGPEATPQIIIVTPDRKRHLLSYWDLKAGNFINLEKGVSWQLARSRSGKVTLLALMLKANIKQDEFTRFQNPYTIVAKLTPKEVCVVARVPVNSTSSADLAAASTYARDKTCVELADVGEKDWMGVVFGLIGKERYKDAKSVVKKMANPAARISAYANIARAQFESGDRPAARITILLGLDEVLKEKDETIYPNAYGLEVHQSTRDSDWIVILSTMAAVGLDEDVKNNLKFVSDSNLPATLLWIGKAQGSAPAAGGRGDLEAATATFNRAIQLEIKRADTRTADSNLASIIGAQAELGLVNEARKTVLLIKNPGARQAAEHTIDWSTKMPD